MPERQQVLGGLQYGILFLAVSSEWSRQVISIPTEVEATGVAPAVRRNSPTSGFRPGAVERGCATWRYTLCLDFRSDFTSNFCDSTRASWQLAASLGFPLFPFTRCKV
jgi:hypothetical protein